MIKKIYLRVAKTNNCRLKVSAHNKPNYRAFDDGNYRTNYYPTLLIPILLNIPDNAFNKVAKELKIKMEEIESAININVVKKQ